MRECTVCGAQLNTDHILQCAKLASNRDEITKITDHPAAEIMKDPSKFNCLNKKSRQEKKNKTALIIEKMIKLAGDKL